MKESIITYEGIAVLYRIAGIFLLYLNWIKTGKSIAGVVLLLCLVILMLLRWRFVKLRWTILIDQFVIMAASLQWENSYYALSLSAFEVMFSGSFILLIPILLSSIFLYGDILNGIFIVQSVFSGLCLYGWRKQKEAFLKRMDGDGKRNHELESIKQELLAANISVAKMAELSERSRIARDIHDNAGHEIIAAYMSLQTVQELLKADTNLAEELFGEALGRLETGIDKIREAVHNLAPLTDLGVAALRKLCEEFTYCPAELKVYGDTAKVPVYLWMILEPCLKEALTNILRHSEAKSVMVDLDITSHIVRLCVENDGGRNSERPFGIGLRNLSQRAMSVGGNISVDSVNGYRVVCVLPLHTDGS